MLTERIKQESQMRKSGNFPGSGRGSPGGRQLWGKREAAEFFPDRHGGQSGNEW